MTEPSQPWDAFLLAGRPAERYNALPADLRDAIEKLIDAACDLADEAYGDPLSSAAPTGMKVQAEHSSPGGRAVLSKEFARFLNGRAVRQLDRLRTEIRVMLCSDQGPRTGPRFR